MCISSMNILNFLPDWCTAGVSIHCLRGWLLERFRDVTRAISPNKSSIKSIPPNHTDRNRDNEYWCLGNIGFWQIDDALCGCIFSPLEVIALIIGHYAHYADGSSIKRADRGTNSRLTVLDIFRIFYANALEATYNFNFGVTPSRCGWKFSAVL